MEVEEFQMFELGPRRREQLLAHLHMGIHRAADVEKQQHLDRVAPLGPHMDVQPALPRRAVDGGVHVQLVRRALSREPAQPAQRHLDVARAQFDLVVQVPVLALLPHLDRAAMLAGPADAHPLRIVAAVAERAGPAGADPLVPALVPTLLLLQALLQRLHQLFEATQGLDLRLLLVGQIFLVEQLQPVLGHVQRGFVAGPDGFDPGEHLAEHLIEPVVVFLVLDQHRPRQMVEVIDPPPGHILVHGLHQVEPFLHRHGHFRVAQGGEEGEEHGDMLAGLTPPPNRFVSQRADASGLPRTGPKRAG